MIDILVDNQKFSLSNHTLKNNPTFIITQLLNGSLQPSNYSPYIERVNSTTFRIDISPKLFEKIVEELRMSNVKSHGVLLDGEITEQSQLYDNYMRGILHNIPRPHVIARRELNITPSDDNIVERQTYSILSGGSLDNDELDNNELDNDELDNLRIFEKPTIDDKNADNDDNNDDNNSIDSFVKNTNNIFANKSYDNTTHVHELENTIDATTNINNVDDTLQLNTVNIVSSSSSNTGRNDNNFANHDTELELRKLLTNLDKNNKE
jgi:hypothetical protein